MANTISIVEEYREHLGCSDEAAAMVAIADALYVLGGAVQRLGNGNASTDVGAIEGLAMKIAEGLSEVENGLCCVSTSLDNLKGDD